MRAEVEDLHLIDDGGSVGTNVADRSHPHAFGGMFAGVINSMAGGGSLLTVPLLSLAGVDGLLPTAPTVSPC